MVGLNFNNMYVITQTNINNVNKILTKLKDNEDPIEWVEDYIRSIKRHGLKRNTNHTWLGYISINNSYRFIEIRITQVNKLKTK